MDMPILSFQEITFETVRAITALDVAPEQRPCVAPNAVSIAEAYFNPGALSRGPIAPDQIGL